MGAMSSDANRMRCPCVVFKWIRFPEGPGLPFVSEASTSLGLVGIMWFVICHPCARNALASAQSGARKARLALRALIPTSVQDGRIWQRFVHDVGDMVCARWHAPACGTNGRCGRVASEPVGFVAAIAIWRGFMNQALFGHPISEHAAGMAPERLGCRR